MTEKKAASTSYDQILRSTAWIGGATLVTLAIGVVRTKFLALWLGPTGIGLHGIYTSILACAVALAGMGISNSGVRQVSQAIASADGNRIARTVKTLRCTAFTLGLIGAFFFATFGQWLSVITFGNSNHSFAISALGVAVFASCASAGQMALIQGLRRVADLARVNVFGAIGGTLIGIPLVWAWNVDGIVPLIIISATSTLFFSWRYSHQLEFRKSEGSWFDSITECRVLLSLGLAFVLSGLMTSGTVYLIRLFLVQELGLEASGFYSAAYTLAGIYCGVILQAMGADFYPRLAAVASENKTIVRLVNEQTEIGLLIGLPGVLATLALAPWVIQVFYDGRFDPAVPVLKWQLLGILGRIVSWPMGFILIARGRQFQFVVTELATNIIHITLIFFLMNQFGLVGTGVAFAILYLFHVILMFLVCRRECGFAWSVANKYLLGLIFLAVAISYIVDSLAPSWWRLMVLLLIFSVSVYFSGRTLAQRMLTDHMSVATHLRTCIDWFGRFYRGIVTGHRKVE